MGDGRVLGELHDPDAIENARQRLFSHDAGFLRATMALKSSQLSSPRMSDMTARPSGRRGHRGSCTRWTSPVIEPSAMNSKVR